MSDLPTQEKLEQTLRDSCPVLKEMLDSGLATDASGNAIPTFGMSTIKNLLVLRRLMETGRFGRTLEVGLAHGGSALTLAAAHRDLGHPPQSQHTAVDPFQNGFLKGVGLAGLARGGLSSYVEHVSEFSQLALPAFAREGRRYGLIYIDGSHSFDDVFVDFYFCDQLLDPGGFIVFDDCGDKRVRKVTRFVTRNYAQAYTEVGIDDLFVLSQPARLRLARVLGRNQTRVFQRMNADRRTWDSPLRPF